MRRRHLVCLLALALLPVTQQACAKEVSVRVVGAAFDLDSTAPLYTETHCVSDNALTHDVLYRDMEQELIAHKVLNYSSGPLTPSFVQHNFYSQEVIAVELRQDQLIMTVKAAGNPEPQEFLFPVSQASMPIVIDAGFDNFVTQNWNALVGGQSKQFQFPFAARESLVDLRVKAARCSYSNETDQCFILRLDNWLIGRLVSSIELGYDPVLKRLTRFRGLSNIGDAKGAGQSVDIRYRYEDLSPVACTSDELNLMGKTPDSEIATTQNKDRS
tara:strand:- start:3732 stop:4547 length:816 start_codon:yes stop_codon:yes gene_type:complete